MVNSKHVQVLPPTCNEHSSELQQHPDTTGTSSVKYNEVQYFRQFEQPGFPFLTPYMASCAMKERLWDDQLCVIEATPLGRRDYVSYLVLDIAYGETSRKWLLVVGILWAGG